jgi:hypothetical protein
MFGEKNQMKILRSESGNAIGIKINAISFRSLLRALRSMPELKVERAKQNPMTDEAFATFRFKGVMFEIDTPLSDYWIDKPKDCPETIFKEIVQHLEQYRVRWWHRFL